MKSKLSRILKDLRAQRESIYGRRFANQSTPLDWMRLAKEALPNATRLSPFDVKREKRQADFS